MEKIFIRDFTPNQTISTTSLVISKELRNKKTGGQFALITLSDKTGDITGQWWDNFEDTIDAFDRDDIVFARGLVTVYRNHLQLSIHRMRLCQEREYSLTDYFPTTKYDVDGMFAELMAIIGEFKNEYLRRRRRPCTTLTSAAFSNTHSRSSSSAAKLASITTALTSTYYRRAQCCTISERSTNWLTTEPSATLTRAR